MREFRQQGKVIPVQIEVHWGPAGPIWHEDSAFFNLAVVEANGCVSGWEGAVLHRQPTGYRVVFPDQYLTLPRQQRCWSREKSPSPAYWAVVIQAILDSALRERP